MLNLEEIIAYARKRNNKITISELNQKFESIFGRELRDNEVNDVIEILEEYEIDIIDELEMEIIDEFEKEIIDEFEIEKIITEPEPVDYSTLSIFQAYMKDVSRIKTLSEAEKRQLIIKASKGDTKAKQKFANQYLKLVVSIARKCYRNNTFSSLTEDDLIGYGNLGLLKAIDRYDYKKGFRFTTYATWWIRQSIYMGVKETDREIRTPAYASELLNKFKKYIAQYYQLKGLYPTNEELMEELKITERQLKNLYSTININNLAHLDEPVGQEEDSTLSDFVPSKAMSIEDQIEEREKHELLMKAFNILLQRKLADVERQFSGSDKCDPEVLKRYNSAISKAKQRVELLKNRYGILVEKPEIIASPEIEEKIRSGQRLTLRELGEKYGISRERARQVSNGDYKKLVLIAKQLMNENPYSKKKTEKKSKPKPKKEKTNIEKIEIVAPEKTLFESTYKDTQEQILYEDVCANKQVLLCGKQLMYPKRILIETIKKYDLFWIMNKVRSLNEIDRLATLFDIYMLDFNEVNKKLEELKLELKAAISLGDNQKTKQYTEEMLSIEEEYIGALNSIKYLIERVDMLPKKENEYFMSLYKVEVDNFQEKIKKK